MDYKARRRHTVADTNGPENDYPHDIQMYDIPPMGEMSLEEFQELGFDRLKGDYIIFAHANIKMTKLNYCQLCLQHYGWSRQQIVEVI